MKPADLIDYIVWYATTRGDALTPIRLVKFLYLLDLFAARLTGQTLTGWPWAFVHYGPFCGEALDAIEIAVRRGVIEAHPFTSRYDGEQHFIYRSPRRDRPTVAETLPLAALGALERAIQQWGGDTAGLLDHIYFETEPMISALPGERLDFSLACWPERPDPVPLKRLSPQQVKNGKAVLARLRERTALGIETNRADAAGEIRDDVYRTFMRQLRLEDGLPGTDATALFETHERHSERDTER